MVASPEVMLAGEQSRARILFVHNGLVRFVRIDRDLLAQRFRVTELLERNLGAVRPRTIAQQVRNHDLVFCWFASWHSVTPIVLARLMRKPSVLIIGGYDIAKMPEIGYGHQRGGLKRQIANMAIRCASVLVTHSWHCQQEAVLNVGADPARVRVVYLGVPDSYGGFPDGRRESMVLTVGNVDRSNLTRKGHEPFVRAASLLPDVKFVLAGAWRDNSVRHLQRIAPANVCFTGWVEDSALADLYARSSAYLQLSCHEGFGMSVAEAMLAGSIPIVSKVGSLPEVVGDVGRFVVREDPAAVAGAIRDVLASSTQARKAVRNRILLNFSVGKRQKALWRIIDELLNVLCY